MSHKKFERSSHPGVSPSTVDGVENINRYSPRLNDLCVKSFYEIRTTVVALVVENQEEWFSVEIVLLILIYLIDECLC